jgi:hypothetical protein
MTQPDDWRWFRAHPDRVYRMRLATSAEIASIDQDDVDPARFLYSLVRRLPHAAELQIILAAFDLLDLADIDEIEIEREWFRGDAIVGAWIERPLQ